METIMWIWVWGILGAGGIWLVLELWLGGDGDE